MAYFLIIFLVLKTGTNYIYLKWVSYIFGNVYVIIWSGEYWQSIIGFRRWGELWEKENTGKKLNESREAVLGMLLKAWEQRLLLGKEFLCMPQEV